MTGIDDRAQLMLIGAVVIAVAMLALVTVLNSTIYAQNVAPGNTLDETRETNEQLRVVQRDVTRITERLQEKHGYVDEARLNGTLQEYARHRTEHTAWRSPAHVDVELNRTANFTVLRHDDNRHFRSAGNDDDWTLVENTSFAGKIPFETTVSPQDSGQPLRFIVSGNASSETWSIEFIQPPSTDNVETTVSYNDGTTESYSHPDSTVAVNVTAGTINGSKEFDFSPDVDGPYDIRIENGQHVGNGSYIITVDDHSDVKREHFHDNRTAGNPYTSQAVSTAVVDVRYGTGSVTMDTQVEVTPE